MIKLAQLCVSGTNRNLEDIDKDRLVCCKTTQASLYEYFISQDIPISRTTWTKSPALPKTRSGKIMRRILRKVAANDLDTLGDTSTLADPAVVDDLIANRAL